ncbi:deoxyribose-phosphate aldolase [Vallitalea longa]|uniref:Deoxyribose-phosphate aldolase n=1 Tax=Vallitalea longa TaxID=2936439 RepID=A0A9W6DEB4_9FIRM|nr:deoxyribose-phosphate aldolase [Vallitalea longa]GKX28248.1 deoxyribose-phosphate aldolase [Vallitalea longa]
MNLSKYIDHTILKPNASEDDVKKICDEAKKYNFASVCVNPSYVKYVSSLLKGTDIMTCAVIGFPLGATPKEVKAYEASNAIQNGAEEVDMVINVGYLKSKKYNEVEEDIKAVVDTAKGKAHVKVIIETCLLTDDEKVKACELSVAAGADFVKTSTGFSTGGATIEDVRLMKRTVGNKAKVKASGGIRDYDKAVAMIEAGADRIGTSSGVAFVNNK